jgi:hypothetical protein
LYKPFIYETPLHNFAVNGYGNNVLCTGHRACNIPLYPDGVINAKPTPATYVEATSKQMTHISKVSIPTITPFYPGKR